MVARTADHQRASVGKAGLPHRVGCKRAASGRTGRHRRKSRVIAGACAGALVLAALGMEYYGFERGQRVEKQQAIISDAEHKVAKARHKVCLAVAQHHWSGFKQFCQQGKK